MAVSFLDVSLRGPSTFQTSVSLTRMRVLGLEPRTCGLKGLESPCKSLPHLSLGSFLGVKNRLSTYRMFIVWWL